MMYFAVFLVLFVLELIYFKIADRFNIIDKPNHRSAHTEITLRGGGIVFPIAFLLFFIISTWGKLVHLPLHDQAAENHNYLIFGVGLLLLCTISFLDDLYDLSSKIRIVFHIISVSFLLAFLNAFVMLPIWAIPVLYILIIGILNAYNFMDGINGITGLYSLVALLSLLYVNQNMVSFVNRDFIIYPVLACLVFLFFNFRKKAKCFMGDIGSMGIAFWVVALIGLLMMKTGEIKWILFLAVYGVEVISTILERLKLKENIFEAHRRHLYQLLANEKKISHLIVSTLYAAVQLIINAVVIFSNLPQIVSFVIILLPALIFYLYTKLTIKKQITLNIN
ncbi:UDP-GlcNAc--UDP-phosphate GlcNAc-1-phosphate transferase [Kaistella haifensis DSM 19056]|uniref:UDP-GlcNAc--UDP-phosphate GlcNAc-1-phosphate transferase n=1 Tax=Kaistella haifensis DSM 19056 TaxID=1450526 RepID=A0A2D0A6N5_9FLAO|nr:glycosyltransferase family 4 protein [Kaistella haifensis]OWK98344.1 UDP-GlcNAc--UDP-phosphate GlcNAc-1-phosphate transferase [Kaistella haifensis DSM 19056]